MHEAKVVGHAGHIGFTDLEMLPVFAHGEVDIEPVGRRLDEWGREQATQTKVGARTNENSAYAVEEGLDTESRLDGQRR